MMKVILKTNLDKLKSLIGLHKAENIEYLDLTEEEYKAIVKEVMYEDSDRITLIDEAPYDEPLMFDMRIELRTYEGVILKVQGTNIYPYINLTYGEYTSFFKNRKSS